MTGGILRAARSGAALLFGAGAAASAWALAEAHSYVLRRRTILMPSRGAGHGPRSGAQAGSSLRILHLSDLHFLARQRRKSSWVGGLAELGPDLVVCTGDMIAQSKALAPLLSALSPLSGTPGVFVFGSNDYYRPRIKNPLRYLSADPSPKREDGRARMDLPWREMAAAFEQAGWLDLTNARGRLDVRGWRLDFVGVDDPHLRRDAFPPASGSDAEPASPRHPGASADGGRSPGASADLRIGVTHAPYSHVLDEMVADGCSLVFAGHTHGGQVCLPGLGALVTNCDLPPDLAAGLFRWPDPGEVVRRDGFVPTLGRREPWAWVNVSAGLGTSPFAPIRVACRPEAVLVDLVVV